MEEMKLGDGSRGEPLGKLVYDFGGHWWCAAVYKAGDGVGFDLVLYAKSESGVRETFSGTFETGVALHKYVKQLAKKRFSHLNPRMDTIERLRTKDPRNVVPECFTEADTFHEAGGKGWDKCIGCPYRFNCGGEPGEEKLGDRLRRKMPIEELVELPLVEPEENKETWLTRLKGKIKEKGWMADDNGK